MLTSNSVHVSLPAWRARRVFSYVEDNLAARITTAAAARHLDLSASHFSRAFSRSFGITFHAYVMRRRIETAKLLMMTNRSVALSDIALSCGMSDQSHLTRRFRRIVGVTPGSWRRAHHEQTQGARP